MTRPAAVAGMVEMSTGESLSPLHVNSFRISTVTGRLLAHVQGQTNTDKSEFCNLCFSLARGIDYAVSNNDIPHGAPDLPYLLKQVCQMKNDLTSQAAIMVLMISVKSACSNGWFSEKMKDELYALSNEMQSSFCSISVDELNSNMKNKESNFDSTISTIMSRFYPGMKMGKIFSLVEKKPGYDSYLTDLHISKSSRTSPHDKIYLFVAQTDDIDTSACLISPQQVNFLLNGEGINKRNCLSKDLGPQMPTNVTHMLKYGSNLFQVVGQFNGRYIIVIAFMSIVSNPVVPTIDYVPPVAAQLDSDNEIVEGPSRVSLKCPLSFSRFKIPVKGHSCKHLQCFDFNNYVGINSRRPFWCCPHCSQSVCFHDIRIDQSMVKILKEVGEDVTHVKISGDGSLEAVTENNSNELTQKPNIAQPLIQETSIQNVDDIMDLTEDDNESDEFDRDDDTIPPPVVESSVCFHDIRIDQSMVKILKEVGEDVTHVKISGDSSWEAVTENNSNELTEKPNDAVSLIQETSIQNVDDIMDLTEDDNENNEFDRDDDTIPSPVVESSVMNNNISSNMEEGFWRELYSSALSDIQMKWNHLLLNSLTQGQSQSQLPVSSSMQSQQNENTNNNGPVRYPTPPTWVTRTRSTIHAHPAQHSSRTVDGDRQQIFSRTHYNQHMSSQSQGLHSSQNHTFRARSVSSQPISGHRHTSPLLTEFHSSHEKQSVNQRAHLPVQLSDQPTPHVRPGGAHSGVGSMTSLPSSHSAQYSSASVQRATSQPSIPPPNQTSGSSFVPVATSGDKRGSSAEENWKPTGRMRGSLSGQQYTEALRNQTIIEPSQPVQASRPPLVLNAPRPFIPPHLQALMANNNLRPPAGGSCPGSDGSLAGAAARDK